jgi:hypothetical protein
MLPTPGSQVLGTAGVPLFITRWTRHPHGESMDAKKIVSSGRLGINALHKLPNGLH